MQEIGSFLAGIGLDDCAAVFADNDVDMDVLRELSEADLKELGLSLGHRKKILKALRELSSPPAVASDVELEPGSARGSAKARSTDAERRQLTVVFCDMVGSTALAARLDPEEMFAVISTYQRCCTEIFERFNGHVAKFLGDGVLAYFGYPNAREDDAERAVAASLELISAVNRLSFPDVGQLEARVGIDTGLVVIGELLGGGHAEEDAIVGDTPNLAARLQSVARPSSVVMSANTRRLLAGLFEYRDLGPQDLKGFARPLRAFEVVGFGSAETRFDARKSLGITPLVGRSQELELLTDRWRMARASEGQAVCLVGEGGVGKSRLVSELRDRLSRTPHRVLTYVGAEFHQDNAFFPVARQIARSAGVARTDPAALKIEKLTRMLDSAGLATANAVAIFGWYLGVDHAAVEPAKALPPEDRKALLFSTLIELLERMSARVPLLLLFEDLHWVDPSTIELLRHVINQVRNRKILVICTFRPEFQPNWDREPHVTILQLNRLGRNLGTLMIDRVTGGKAVPPDVIENILDRTDGVPLFVEEFTKNLIEAGVLTLHGDEYRLETPMAELAIPATLQDSLAARLDRLSAAKEIAQWAAALGRSFSEALLLAVVPKDAPEIRSGIQALLASEIIYRRGLPPRETHEFKHALLQEAAYAGMVRTRRAQLHQRIAGVILEKFKEIAESEPETLARHLQAAGLYGEAVPHLISAGDLAAGRYAPREARNLYDAALDLARQLPKSKDAAKAQIKAVLKRASVAVGRAQVESDLADLKAARELADEVGSTFRQAQITYWIGRSHYVSGAFDEAAECAAEALSLIEHTDNNEAVAAAAVNLLARIECLRGRPEHAVSHAARNIKQMGKIGNPIEVAAMHGVQAFGHGLAGQFDEAIGTAKEGASLADATGHAPTQASGHFFHGLVLGWHGSLEASLHAFAKADQYAAQAGDTFRSYVIRGWRGEARLLQGDIDGARNDLEQCQQSAKTLGSNYHLPAFEAFLAQIWALDGRLDDARKLVRRSVKEADRHQQDWAQSIALRILAEIQAMDGDLAAALATIDAALTIHERDGVITDRARALLVKGKLLSALGRHDEAGSAFAQALSLFERMGMAGMVASTRSIWAKTHPNNENLDTQTSEERSA